MGDNLQKKVYNQLECEIHSHFFATLKFLKIVPLNAIVCEQSADIRKFLAKVQDCTQLFALEK